MLHQDVTFHGFDGRLYPAQTTRHVVGVVVEIRYRVDGRWCEASLTPQEARERLKFR